MADDVGVKWVRAAPGRRRVWRLLEASAGGDGAPESVFGPRGESPLQACTLRPVTESKGIAARRGLEQLEVNHRSVG